MLRQQAGAPCTRVARSSWPVRTLHQNDPGRGAEDDHLFAVGHRVGGYAAMAISTGSKATAST